MQEERGRPQAGAKIEEFAKRLTIDFEHGFYEIETVEGLTVRQSAPSLRRPDRLRDFRRTSYNPSERVLTLDLPSGESAEVEVDDGTSSMERRRGRPTAYLDQNKWILLSKALHSPSRVPPRELDAAHDLISLVDDQRVILPLSSGHVVETARADGRWRRRLGPLMMRLSRGWIIRDPLLVRKDELSRLFQESAAPEGHSLDPVGLDLRDLYAEGRNYESTMDADWPSDLRKMIESLTTVTAVFGVLLEDEVTHSEEGWVAAGSWAASHEALARHLAAAESARGRSREATRARFLIDMDEDLSQVVARRGIGVERFVEWFDQDAEEELDHLPYLGRMRDVIDLRLRNGDDRWEGNDFVDMLYLPLAAAYTDFVVAENKTRHYLTQVQRKRTDGAAVMSSIAELVDRLAAVNPSDR